MSETIYTNKKKHQTSFEEQALKDNILFSESLSGVLPEDLDVQSELIPTNILSIGSTDFSVLPTHLERTDYGILVELQIYNFNALDFIDFKDAEIRISQEARVCKLISYSHPKEDVEYGLIKILLAEGA